MKIYDDFFSLVYTFRPHTNKINRIKQQPFVGGYIATASDDRSVKIWNATNTLNNWQLIRSYTGHSSFVLAIEFINADLIATGAADSLIRVWSMNTGVLSRSTNVGQAVRCLQLLSNGRDLAAGLANNNIIIYNSASGTAVDTLRGHTSQVNDLALISNGNLLASSSSDNTIRIWDLNTNLVKYTLTGHLNQVFGLKQVAADILSSGSLETTINLWNITSGRLIRTLTGHTGQISLSLDMLFYDNRTLVSGSQDQTLKVWDIRTGQCLNTIKTALTIVSMAVIDTKMSGLGEFFALFFSFFVFKYFSK